VAEHHPEGPNHQKLATSAAATTAIGSSRSACRELDPHPRVLALGHQIAGLLGDLGERSVQPFGDVHRHPLRGGLCPVRELAHLLRGAIGQVAPFAPAVGRRRRVPSAVDPLRCSAGCLALRVTFLRRLFASGIARASTWNRG